MRETDANAARSGSRRRRRVAVAIATLVLALAQVRRTPAAGIWTDSLSLSGNLQYNDNLLLSPTDRLGDLVFILNPVFGASYESRGSSIEMSYQGNSVNAKNQSQLNFNTHDLRLSGHLGFWQGKARIYVSERYSLVPRNTATFVGYLRTTQALSATVIQDPAALPASPPAVTGAPTIMSAAVYAQVLYNNSIAVAPIVRFNPSARTTLTISAHATDSRYQDPTIPDVKSGATLIGLQWTPKPRLSTEFTHTYVYDRYSFSNIEPVYGHTLSTFARYSPLRSLQLQGALRFSFLSYKNVVYYGFELRSKPNQFFDASISTSKNSNSYIDATIFDIYTTQAAAYFTRRFLRAGLGGFKRADVGNIGTLSRNEFYGVDGSLGARPSAKTLIQVSASYAHSYYGTQNFTQIYRLVGIGGAYAVTRKVGLSYGYTYQRMAGAGPFKNDVFFVGVTANLLSHGQRGSALLVEPSQESRPLTAAVRDPSAPAWSTGGPRTPGNPLVGAAAGTAFP